MSKRRLSWSAATVNSKKNKMIDNDNIKNDDDSDGGNDIDFSKLFKPPQNPSCYTIDNNIYFNDDITMDTITSLNKEIRHLQNKLQTVAIKMGIEPPPIKLHLTTYGGEIHAAFSAIACIKSCKIPVHTYIDGYVASAGTLISICGNKRFIHKHSSMLIHELRSGISWGKMSNLEEEFENLKKMMSKIKDLYVEHTKLKKKDLDSLLKKDTDWHANECLKNGLVDEIIE